MWSVLLLLYYTKKSMNTENWCVVFLLSTPYSITLIQFGTKKKNNKFKAVQIKSKNSINKIFWYLSFVDENTINSPKIFTFQFIFHIWKGTWFLAYNFLYDLKCIWEMFGIQRMTKKYDCDWKCLIRFYLFWHLCGMLKTGIWTVKRLFCYTTGMLNTRVYNTWPFLTGIYQAYGFMV